MLLSTERCFVCDGTGAITSGNSAVSCLKCEGTGRVSIKKKNPPKPNRNQSQKVTDDEWTDKFAVIIGLACAIYFYGQEILGGLESIFAGIVIGFITKYTIKWIFIFGMIYFAYELFLKK